MSHATNISTNGASKEKLPLWRFVSDQLSFDVTVSVFIMVALQFITSSISMFLFYTRFEVLKAMSHLGRDTV
jgi:hypothetical protein